MTATTYEPAVAGGAIALVARSRALLLPRGLEPERRAALADMLATAGVQEVLDLLASGGLALVPPFALVDAGDADRLLVVVRGGFTAVVDTAGGGETVSGEAVSTWVERVIPGATGLTVAVEGATADPVGPLAIAEGIVLAAGLRMDRGAQERAEPATVTATAAPDPVPDTAREPVTQPVPVTDVEATMVDAPTTAEPAVADPEGYDYLFGETMFRGVTEAAVRADEPAEEPEPAPAQDDVDVFTTGGDHDGHTVLTGDIARLRAARTTAAEEPAPAAPPPPPVTPSVVLVFSNGSREDLAQPVLVGRSPSITKVPGTRMPRLITVGGVDQDISRNHAQFALEGGTVVVTDLHSRNGTMIAMPGREPQKLRAGEPTSVLVGTVVDLGSGITITVEGA
ncbi:MAG: hypothetical protein JWN36_1495 [Microbacteriaceae bacterium]|nr:hypothetical protein [Microbacteriaceae bacterium]